MTQHTPGPWQTFPALSNPPSIVIGPVERGDLGFVAQTVGGNDEANARLIAAAPELLEALRDLIIACNMSPGQELTVSLAIENANAAIAKAEK